MVQKNLIDPTTALRMLIQTVGWNQRKWQGFVTLRKKAIEQ